MKIVIVSPHIPPLNTAGSVRINSFIKEWKKNAHIRIISEKSNEDSNRMPDFYSNIKISRAFFSVVNNKTSFVKRLIKEVLFGIYVFFRLLFFSYDFAFISSPPFFPMFFVMLASKIKFKPYIVDIRDLYPSVFFDYGLLKDKSIIGRLLVGIETMIYNNSSAVITVTKGLADNIKKKTDKEVVIINNGIDSTVFKLDKSIEKEKNFIIIFHGTMGNFQDIETIISYANYLKESKISDIQIWVIGDGPKRTYLTEEIKKNNLDDLLHYLGEKSISEIPQYLQKAHVGFSPRIDCEISRTAFPVKVYECLSVGLPVILSPLSDAGKFLENQHIGFQIQSSDLIMLHEKIMFLKNNKKAYESYSVNCVKTSLFFERGELARQAYRLFKI